MSPETRHRQTISELQAQIQRQENPVSQNREACSTGSEAFDRLFPGRGVRRGSLVEWVGRGDASGAGTLSLWVAHQLAEKHRPAVLIDGQQQVFPLPLLALGGDPAAVVLVRPPNDSESLWAFEQALRCEAAAVVWGMVPHLSPVVFRRLKLAAEQAGSVGFFLRGPAALKHPSWADVRLLVEPRPAFSESPCFHVETIYARGSTKQSRVIVQIDSQSGVIHGVSSPQETHFVSQAS